MRHLAPTSCLLVAALGGCLSAPTGQPADAAVDATPRVWPPAGAAVVAIAAGAVDGDAVDDLVVVDAGTDQIYLLTGGVDVKATADGATTYTRSAALSGLEGPAAAVVVNSGAARVVVLDSPAGGARLTILDGALAPIGTSMIPGAPRPPTGSTVGLALGPFGMNMTSSVFIALPTSMWFLENAQLTVATPQVAMPQMPPAGPLTSVLAAGGYRAPSTPPQPRAFVSELARTQRADASAGAWTWTDIRVGGASWLGQIVSYVGATQVPYVIGYEAASPNGKLCVLDVEAATSGCATVGMTLPSPILAAGPIVSAGQLDVVLLDPGAPQGLFVAADLTVNGTTVTTDPQSAPRDLGLAGPRVALAQLDGAGGKEIVVVGASGGLTCSRYAGGLTAPAPCAP